MAMNRTAILAKIRRRLTVAAKFAVVSRVERVRKRWCFAFHRDGWTPRPDIGSPVFYCFDCQAYRIDHHRVAAQMVQGGKAAAEWRKALESWQGREPSRISVSHWGLF